MKKNLVIALCLFMIPFISVSQIVKYGHSTFIDADYYYGGINTHHINLLLDMSLVKSAEIEVLDAIKKYYDVPTIDLNTFLKADIDLRNGNYHIALKELEIFIKERNNSPFVPSAWLFSGYIELETGNYSSAERYFLLAKSSANYDKSVRTDKQHYDNIEHSATYWLAISLCQQGKYLDAIPYFTESQKNFPNYIYAAQSLYALGSIAEMDKDYEKAISYYNRIESEYPYSNVILASLIRNANDRLLLRNPQSALIYIQRAENIYRKIIMKDSVGMLYAKQDFNENYLENIEYLQGEAYNQVAQYDQAIKHFNEVVNSYPKSNLMDFVNMGIGWAYLNKMEYENAIDYFQKVIDSRLDYSPTGNISNVKAIAYLNKISALKKLKRIDEAQAELSLLAVRPNFPQLAFVQLELSQIYYENADYDLARKTLERAEREADNPKVLIRITSLLAASYLELKQYSKAAETYKKVIDIGEKADVLLIPNKDWYIVDACLKQGIALVSAQRSNEAITPLLKYISLVK
ncbi:MAG: tetratricopeptide repeat protein [Bacteroidetes bacterium]|nr:tetratricopeptide repeat protein [Bacteroidota bacterium]